MQRRLVDLKRLREMPMRRLNEIVIEVQSAIQELEKAPVRDIDIAVEHTGKEKSIHQVVRTRGNAATGR